MTERVVGTAGLWLDDKTGYLDLPDGVSTWELSNLTWDIAFKSRDEQQDILNSIGADLAKGMEWNEVRGAHVDTWRDLAGKVILDPLWLVGGLGLAVRSAETAAKSNKALNLIKHGLIGGEGAAIKLSRSRAYQWMSGVPVLGRVFRLGSSVVGIPPLEREIVVASEQWVKAQREVIRWLGAGGPRGNTVRQGFALSRHTMATLAYQGAHDAYRLPLAAASNLTPKEYILALESIASKTPDLMPSRLGAVVRQADVMDTGARVFERAGIKTASDIKVVANFLKEAAESPEILEDTGRLTNLSLEIFNELAPRTQRAASELMGINLSEPTSKLFSAMRYSLNVTLLNRPGFVGINVLENFGKILWDDPRAGLRFLTGGLIPSRALKIGEHLGLGKNFVPGFIADASTGRAGGLAGETGLGAMIQRKGIQPFVSKMGDVSQGFIYIASMVDYGGRITSFFNAFEKSVHFNLHKFIPTPSTRVTDALGRTRLDAIYATAEEAATTGGEGFNLLRKSIQDGLPFTSVDPLYRDWLRAQGWADDAVQTLTADGREVIGSIDEAVHVGTSIADTQRAIDEIQGTLINRIQVGRDTMMLEPVGRIRVGGHMGELANFEAMATQRTESLLGDLQRFFKTNSVPNRKDILRVLREPLNTLRDGRQRLWELLNSADPDVFRQFTEYTAESARVFDNMVNDVARLLRDGRPELGAAWIQISGNLQETERVLNRTLGQVLSDLRTQPLSLSGMIESWDTAFDDFYTLLNNELRFRKNIMGVRPRSLFRRTRHSAIDGPSWFDGKTLQEMEQLRFMQEQATQITELFTNPLASGDFAGITREARDELLSWLDELEPAIGDLRTTGVITGRQMANWTMLNYDRHFGAEDPMRWIFPYITWPTRSMHRWAGRFLATPGRAASLAQLRQVQEDINIDLPNRLKGQWRIPIPGVAQDVLGSIMGVEPENIDSAIYFDPIRTMMSPFSFAQEFNNADKTSTPLGAVLDYVGGLGPAMNPLLPRALALTGMGLDRDAWLQDSWFRSVPIPFIGSGATVGLRAIFGDSVTDSKFADILLGRELTPDFVIKKFFGIPDDKFDPWRIRRAAGSLVNVENEKIRTRMKAEGASKADIKKALESNTTKWEEQILATAGPEWEKARKFASTEFGIRNLSSWALGIPVSTIAEGEKMQRGIDAIQDSAVLNGRAAEFYEAYPEYTVWSAARSSFGDDPNEEKRQLSTDAFYFEQGLVREFWSPRIDELQSTVNSMQDDESFLRTEDGRFRLRVARDELAAAKSGQREELNALEAHFPFADLRPSLKRLPSSRSKTVLENIYYDILGNDYDMDDEDKITIEKEDALALFRNRLRTDARSAEWWFNFNVRYMVTNLDFERQIGLKFANKEFDEGQALRNDRELALERLTDEAARNVTWSEFERHLERNRRPPSAIHAAFLQAQEEFSIYLAILDERTGLTENERKRAGNIYRDSHPLIDRFYGNEREQTLIDFEAAARMNQIRGTYYEKARDTGDQMDYLFRVLDEYNEMARRLGIPEIDLQDWMPPFDERDDLYLPGTMPPKQFIDQLLEGRYRHLLE